MVARGYKFHDKALYSARQKDIAEYKQSYKDKIKTLQEHVKYYEGLMNEKKKRLKEIRAEYKNKFSS